MSKMKDALADVEQSLLDGITADQLEKWLKDQGRYGPLAVVGNRAVDLDWWHEQRLTVVKGYLALLRPEDQPDDLAGGAA
tara:strand:+ start:12188 stop:12427 length:240 start_codon:yes stop_codon:yes gene_type:complete